MEKINFEDGQLISPASVNIEGTIYPVKEAEYEGTTPLSAFLLNKMQENIENAIDVGNVHKYTVKLTTFITSEQPIKVPAKYKVGKGCLDVYCNGEKLIKATDNDTQGHYYEVGKIDSVSNIIGVTSDWMAEPEDVFEFVIRGEYNDTSM